MVMMLCVEADSTFSRAEEDFALYSPRPHRSKDQARKLVHIRWEERPATASGAVETRRHLYLAVEKHREGAVKMQRKVSSRPPPSSNQKVIGLYVP